jgi:hypothetical protein
MKGNEMIGEILKWVQKENKNSTLQLLLNMEERTKIIKK